MTTLSTVAAFGFPDFDPPVVLGLYRELGCTSCQFYRNEQNPPTVADARRIAAEAGLPIDSIHGVFGTDYDPSSPEEAARRRAVEVYRREGELAAALGGPMVVVHPAPPAPPTHRITEAERQGRAAPLRRTMADLAAVGEQLGVVYLFENLPASYWAGEDPVQLAGWVRELGSPHVRMCFDLGHAQMTGAVAERLRPCADVVDYLHVHDNDGQVDDHRMPGDGVMDWESVGGVLRATALAAPAMLEVFYPAEGVRRCVTEGRGERLARWLNVTMTKTGDAGARRE